MAKFMIDEYPILSIAAAFAKGTSTVSYTHLRAHETKANLVCRLLLEKKKNKNPNNLIQI